MGKIKLFLGASIILFSSMANAATIFLTADCAGITCLTGINQCDWEDELYNISFRYGVADEVYGANLANIDDQFFWGNGYGTGPAFSLGGTISIEWDSSNGNSWMMDVSSGEYGEYWIPYEMNIGYPVS